MIADDGSEVTAQVTPTRLGWQVDVIEHSADPFEPGKRLWIGREVDGGWTPLGRDAADRLASRKIARRVRHLNRVAHGRHGVDR